MACCRVLELRRFVSLGQQSVHMWEAPSAAADTTAALCWARDAEAALLSGDRLAQCTVLSDTAPPLRLDKGTELAVQDACSSARPTAAETCTP